MPNPFSFCFSPRAKRARGAGPLAAALALMLASCAHVGHRDNARTTSGLAAELPRYSFVLLGEVHDNAQGHALRARALGQAVDAGWRPAIAMEQFDRENQALLDRAMQTCGDADCVIRAASPGKSGWTWDYYKPVIDLALSRHLALYAADLSRADAGRVMQKGLRAVFSDGELRRLGLDGAIPADLLKAQTREVVRAHCGMLPKELETGMATAQIARDAVMASILRRAAQGGSGAAESRPVVLLAGNGHVRRDRGVPRWLDASSVLSVGFTEDAAAPGEFDRDIVIPAAARPDPCESLRGHAFKHAPARPDK